MIRTLLWKEYRDQRLFALLLVGVAAGHVAVMPFAAPMLKIPSQDVIAIQQGVLILFAVLCGVVSGALHWSVERENGTEEFLDMMPVPRAALWRTKTVYAIGQWALQMAVLGTIALVFGLFDSNDAIVMALIILALSSAWLTVTIATSASCRTVLGSIGRAIPFAVVVQIVGTGIFLAGMAQLDLRTATSPARKIWLEVCLGLIWTLIALSVPVYASYRRITNVDRARGQLVDHAASPGRRAFMTAWLLAMHDVRSLAWPTALLIAPNVFLAGSEPILAWLLFGTLLGAWFGVSVTDAEKHGGAYKLWADQRLPVGRLWSVKVLHRLLLLLVGCIAIVFVVASVIFVKLQAKGMQANRSFAAIWTASLPGVTPPWTLLLLGPLFGLGTGLVFALITPKKVISILGAGLAALALTVFWLPMVGSGGIRLWQWLGVPMGLAVTARVLVWPWAAGQLSTRAALAGLLLPILGIGGYWFGVEFSRIAAVPNLAPLFDEAAFMSDMRTTQASQAGDRLSEVASEIKAIRDEAVLMPNPIAGMSAGMVDSSAVLQAPLGRPSYEIFWRQINLAVEQGMKDIKPEVRNAFDKFLTAEWVAKIEALAAADVEYANLGDIEVQYGYVQGYEKRWLIQLAGQLLLIDAILKVEAGDASGALARIDQALRVARWLGRRVPYQLAMANHALTHSVLATHDYWRSRRTSKADVDLLRQANAMFQRHLARKDSDEDDVKSEYLTMKATATDTRNILDFTLLGNDVRVEDGAWSRLSSLIWTIAIGVEPETERRQRLYDLWIAGYLTAAKLDHPSLHRLATAHGNSFEKSYFYGERYFNFGDWVSPTLPNPSPVENQAAWEDAATLIHSDIHFRYWGKPYFRGAMRNIARKKAIFELIELANTLWAHRLLHGDWPKSLAEIDAPGFGPVPNNPMTGEQYVYERTPKGVVLKAPDPFPTEKNKHPRNAFDLGFGGQRYALEFEIPSFDVK